MEATKTERAAYQKKYYEENRERLKAKNRKWKEDNRELYKVYCAKYYKENSEKVSEKSAQWALANPEKIRAHATKCNHALRAAVIVRLGGCCVRCAAVDNLEFDHVHDNGHAHRRALGGPNCTQPTYYWMRDAPLEEVLHGKYAIQLLCNECHRTKDKWTQKPDLFFKQAA